jgi:mono/diheme cytochrome c family protein
MRNVGRLAKSVGATGAVIAILLAGSSARAGQSDPQEFTQIERGRYLAVASDCVSCHTVPGSDTPFAGGRVIETPFGGIVAPNITPDSETGIGAWSDGEFDAAVRKGVRRDGAPLYPAMPYNAYTKMSREDVQAIRAYLATVTPVRNPLVAKSLPFPPWAVTRPVAICKARICRDGLLPTSRTTPGSGSGVGRWARSSLT